MELLPPTNVWVWTLLAVVLTWTVFHATRKTKKKSITAEVRKGCGGTDVIIVGAGVAGATLAYALATDGRRVHVIERDLREPDRMMGEVMQPGGRLMLAKLGLQDCLEEIEAQKLTGLVVYKDGKHGIAPYPVDDNFPYEPCARGFRNGRFVQRLRHKAASLPNVRMEEGTVSSLVEDKTGDIKGVKYKSKTTGEETIALAALTVVCDGAYSNLRRFLHSSKVELYTYSLGFVAKNCRLEDPNSLHLIMSKPTITMLYQISNDEVRCTTEVLPENVPSGTNDEMISFLEKVFVPQLPPKLRDIFVKGINAGPEIKKVPTKRMTTSLSCKNKKGVIVLGDAFNMRHPVIASGMMVVLSDIVILRDLLRPLDNLNEVKKLSEIVKSFHQLRKPMSTTVNTLADLFHRVLCASKDEAREAMRQECFVYLCSGGVFTSGLMSLIGGMNPRPLSLVLHLFSITFSSIATLLAPFPTPQRVWLCLRLLRVALGMLGPHVKDEGVTQMFSPAAASAYRKRYMTLTAA
ncbi:PREDICTED: squalene epoxidase 5-like [Tarenaya hassleriana]|uniref:squalene epoxidase 5-like n=1 Tax=Tarenaya hassleriana TaxID=28532 RepID=UPI00053C9BE8|nr:PREDICTED: squalene epoxidase 5-like [Tarenaya hassleriana]